MAGGREMVSAKKSSSVRAKKQRKDPPNLMDEKILYDNERHDPIMRSHRQQEMNYNDMGESTSMPPFSSGLA